MTLKINFSEQIKNYDGTPFAWKINNQTSEVIEYLTFATITTECLNILDQRQRENISALEAFKIGKFILKIVDGGEHEIPENYAKIVRERVHKIFSPVIVALVWEKFGGTEEELENKS